MNLSFYRDRYISTANNMAEVNYKGILATALPLLVTYLCIRRYQIQKVSYPINPHHVMRSASTDTDFFAGGRPLRQTTQLSAPQNTTLQMAPWTRPPMDGIPSRHGRPDFTILHSPSQHRPADFRTAAIGDQWC
jgi:hypothetical protein